MEFCRYAVIAGLAVETMLLGACDTSANVSVTPTKPPATAPVQGPQRPNEATVQDTRGLPADLFQSYPELLHTDLRVVSKQEVPVSSGVPTEIYNMTGLDLNPQAIEEIYSKTESLVYAPITQAMNYTLPEGRMMFKGNPYTGVNFRRTIIIPKGTARPDSWKTPGETLNFSETLALTNIDRQRLGLRTFIEATDQPDYITLPPRFKNPQAFATILFATEACQQVVYIRVFNGEGIEQTDHLLRLTGQEVFCNIIGYGFAAR